LFRLLSTWSSDPLQLRLYNMDQSIKPKNKKVLMPLLGPSFSYYFTIQARSRFHFLFASFHLP